MTDSAILRVPTGPQYSYLELKLEFESYDQLNAKIDELHNGLLAKLSAAVSTACELAKLEPSAMEQIEAWEGRHAAHEAIRDAPSVVVGDDMDPMRKTEADIVKQELGATMLAQYKTVAPWDGPPAEDRRPAPPWAAPPTPAPAVSGGLNLDDF